jgi:hypothetical protein
MKLESYVFVHVPASKVRVIYPCKGKVIPVTGCGGPKGCETSRLPYILENQSTDGSEVISLMCQLAALYPQEESWYSFLLEAESTPGP